MKRHHAVLNTATTAGGHIVSASSAISIHGVKVALEGDAVYCAACKSTGVIQCRGPRLPERFMGRSVALEHDLCICRCSTPPTLLTAQTMRWQTVGGDLGTPTGQEAPSGRAGFASTASHYDEQSQLDVDATFAEGLPYYILAGSEVLSGRVDASGRVPRVRTSGEGQYQLWVGDEALARLTGGAQP